MQHFEDLWNEAEKLTDGSIEDTLNQLQQISLDFRLTKDVKKLEALVGKNLYALCHITKIYPINSYQALLEQVQSKQIEDMEE